MKKVKLVKAIFTQEEIAAINTKNIKLEEENRKLKEKVKELEEGLDRKEEINKKLRSDLLIYQNQYGCLTN